MICNCNNLQSKMDALEKHLNAQGWAFIQRSGKLHLILKTRDECRFKNSSKTDFCKNFSCASGCIDWEAEIDDKPKYTKEQGIKLLKLQHELKEIAMPVGSMHAFWDIILDIDSMLKGGRTFINDPSELIQLAEKTLNGRA